MAFSSFVDFFALLRSTGSGGLQLLQMPMIDAIMQTLSDQGLLNVSAGPSAPTSNQATTIWLNTQSPSYVGPGTVILFSSPTSSYQPATTALFAAYLFNQINSQSAGAVNDANFVMSA